MKLTDHCDDGPDRSRPQAQHTLQASRRHPCSSRVPYRLPALAVVSVLVGCGHRPATEATDAFAKALSATSATVDAGMGRVADYERQLRATQTAAAYLEADPGTTRGPKVGLPSREPTNADVAKHVLAPGFALLSDYAQQLSAISSGEAFKPLQKSSNDLRQAIGSSLDAVAARKELGVSASAVAAGKQGSEVLLTIVEFTVEQELTNNLGKLVDRADPSVQAFGGTLKAIVGEDASKGLRASLRLINEDLDDDRSLILANLRADSRVSRSERLRSFNEIVASREQDPSDSLLAQMVTVTDQMMAAHSALRSPASLSAKVSVDRFAAAVEQLIAIYQRLHAAGG